MAQQLEFDKALKQARIAQSSQLDALLSLQDSNSLRLQILKESILPVLRDHPTAREFVELMSKPGETARLWLDLISFVEFAPESRTYKLEQERDGRREVLFETADAEEMKQQLLRYLAHSVVAREKATANLSTYVPRQSQAKYDLPTVAYVWVTGLVLGGLAVLAAAMLMGKLSF